jgi:quinol monooxygenase YgiN
MSSYEDVDLAMSFEDQIGSDHKGSVIMVSTYSFESRDDLDGFIAIWSEMADFMRAQPGFVSAQVHRGIGGANVLMNYATWESLEAYRTANAAEHSRAGADELRSRMPENRVIRPVLLERISIPNLCVA